MKHLLLFDGTCGLCTRSAEIARTLDTRGQFAIEPYQAYSEADLSRWSLSYARCSRKVQVVSRTGKVHSGTFAVNHFLWHQQLPWKFLVLLLYVLPVLLICEMAGYELVAHNRHRISAWLGLKACVPKTGS